MSQVKTGWNLKLLYQDDNDPQIKVDLRRVEKENYKFIDKYKKCTDYLKDPATLSRALTELERIERFWGTDGAVGYYFWLRTKLDQDNPRLKAEYNRLHDFALKLENDRQFFLLNLAKIDKKTQKKFLDSPQLSEYKHFLESLFAQARYLLSGPEEKILNLKSKTSHGNWVRMTERFLSVEEREVLDREGKRKTLPFSAILPLLGSKNKPVRDRAAEAVNEILAKQVDLAEVEINSVLEHKKTDDTIRGVPRPDITRHLADDIDTEIVDQMLGVVESRFDLSARFYWLRAKLLGVKKLAYHERGVEYGVLPESFSFPKAVEIISQTAVELDPVFKKYFEAYLRNGQIDVYPQKGKAGGAFLISHLITQPIFILLNFTGTLNDLTTLAHELGHAFNYELQKGKQNALNFGTVTSTTEVASTFMEDFALRKVAAGADEKTRLALLVKRLDEAVGAVFRQVAAYRFEQALHQRFRVQGYLSRAEIGELFREKMSAYMGEAVEQSPGSENWWVYWSHFRTFFYVYSYASGLLIAKALQARLRKEPEFIEEVKAFMAAGLSDSPQNIFLRLGVDIRKKDFWLSGLEEIEKDLLEAEHLAKSLRLV